MNVHGATVLPGSEFPVARAAMRRECQKLLLWVLSWRSDAGSTGPFRARSGLFKFKSSTS